MSEKQKKNTEKTEDLAQQVMQKIDEGQVNMRPRAYFIAGSTLLGVGFAVLLFFATFLINLIAFRFRANLSLDYLLGKPELWNTVCEHPSCLMERLKYSGLITYTCKVCCCGQPCRA